MQILISTHIKPQVYSNLALFTLLPSIALEHKSLKCEKKRKENKISLKGQNEDKESDFPSIGALPK